MAPRKKNKTESKQCKPKALKRQKWREDKSKHYTKIKRQIASTPDDDIVPTSKHSQLKIDVLNQFEKNVTIHKETQAKYSPSLLRKVVSGFLFPVTCLVNFSMTKVFYFSAMFLFLFFYKVCVILFVNLLLFD